MAFTRALLPGFAAPSASSLPGLPCPHGCTGNRQRQESPPALAHTAHCSLQPRHLGEVSHAPSGKNVPKKGCGVLQALAVLEDAARGQSACLWNLLHPVVSQQKCQEQHFSCSSLFLLFLCTSPQGVCCAHRPRPGDAEHKDLKVERPLLLKEGGEVAELRYNRRRRPGTGILYSAASRDASAWSLLSIPAAFSTLSTWPLPQQ